MIKRSDIESIKTYFTKNTQERKKYLLTLNNALLHKLLFSLEQAFLNPRTSVIYLSQLLASFGLDLTPDTSLPSSFNLFNSRITIEDIKDIQLHFYKNAAKQLISGTKNQDAEELLSVSHPLFISVLYDLEEDRSITQAFQQIEHSKLKEAFNAIEQEYKNAEEISDDELGNAFRKIERKNLKQSFELIEAETTTNIIRASRVVRSWRIFAIAATLITTVGIAGYLVFSDMPVQQIPLVRNKQKSKNTVPDMQLPEIPAPVTTSKLIEIDNSDMGFATGQKKMYVEIITYHFETLRNSKEEILKQENNTIKGSENFREKIKSIDSLLNLQGKYTFNLQNKKLVLFTSSADLKLSVESRLNSSGKVAYYLLINKNYYLLTPTNIPKKLIEF